ncbi:MAG TPA: hypothetical protein VL688_09140 [Verrucomicrobiae bacterium]|jgi:hypothetical protein|nr:hypothetical protein [Verrucomicrobiae bacterium]
MTMPHEDQASNHDADQVLTMTGRRKKETPEPLSAGQGRMKKR